MKTNYPQCYISLILFLFLIWTLSCSGRPGKKVEPITVPVPVVNNEITVRLINMVSPEENTGFKMNEAIKVILSPADSKIFPDSVILSYDGKPVKTIKSAPWEYTIPSTFTILTGRKSIKAEAYKQGKSKTIVTRFMIIYSDVIPKKYGYKVVHTYPHDNEAFTQGLFYYKEYLYEGTGQEAGSSLRKVELETGRVIRQHDLAGSLFGEGITLYDNRIYQVTWQNKVGFVYDESTFKEINKIYYTTEGWGLTTINNRIVMSDGTNILYFYEPETFTVVARIEVYDNKQKVDSLNELEYIKGEIWANIWLSDRIVRIDPSSGKVLGYINLKGILNDPETDTREKVLNGIAYDIYNDRIFVTGKNWPKLFEIKVTE